MKKWKRIMAFLLCLTLLSFAVPSVQVDVFASELPSVTMDGASIRTTGKSGLRFKITVKNVSRSLNYGIALTHNDKTVTVSLENGYDKVYSYDKATDTLEYTAVITGLQPSDFDKSFDAVGFVTFKQDNEEVTLNTNTITRSIQKVADLAGYVYDSTTDTWTATNNSQTTSEDTVTEAITTEVSKPATTESVTTEVSEPVTTTESVTTEVSEPVTTTESVTTEVSEPATTESVTTEVSEPATTTESVTTEVSEPTTSDNATTQAPSSTEENEPIMEIGDFRILQMSDGCSVSANANNTATVTFTNSYDALYLAFPKGKTAADYASVSINLTCEEQFGFALTDSNGNNLKTSYPGYTITYSTTGDYVLTFDTLDTDVTAPLTNGTMLRIMTLDRINTWDAKHTPIILNSITFREKKTSQDNDTTLLKTYEDIFGYVGNAVDLAHLQSADTLSYIKSEYNSVTLGNQMKPDYILQKNFSKTLVSKESATNDLNYTIPDGYEEELVPELNFETVDKTLKIASENGLKMRGHTLIWHSQTPNWFFRENYDSNGDFVTPEVMNQRIIFYVTNVMKHICDSPYADVIYAWDVANEYLHQGTNANNSGWVGVYGDSIIQNGKLVTSPEYVKLAFATASSILESYQMRDSVHLFYNDYNTYGVTTECCELIDYLNTTDNLNPDGQKLCDGIGMQSHLDVMWPKVEYYLKTLDTFIQKGYEIQITELDVTLNYLGNENTEEERNIYWKELMEGIVTRQKESHAITSFTIWGLYDDISWRNQYTPLLFSHSYYEPKEAYHIVIQAAEAYYN